MDHSKTTLVIAAIIVGIALTTASFAVPQQALAYRHHHYNSVKVDQQANSLNNCTGTSEARLPPTVCVNTGTNTADISR
jgi:ribosomal protein L32